ncbi:unnamed protein product (macronuclear) [Paramecium tetraurelia]|uniref:Uncharacterized protein n=1 Tax=Paramecium tetraurelia TaxID=5888 RepID=A0CK27_PARTE|nr:uncharacterized protein GSPATT00000856001 [Paramecium tetraurelia]CAK71144.1 unnamed protein product [Paramecium tetraurelia]|eukprot:XP_001438541.1 hypothetical protein (macronuclear) [Paramecium tetraurelia strain d4-2]
MQSNQNIVDTQIIGLSKSSKIAKQKQKEQRKYCAIKKEFQIIVNIPKTLNMREYLRTEIDIIFSTDYQIDSNLGELCTNIFTVGYKILQTDYFSDKQAFTLSPRDLQCVNIEVIFNLLEKMNLQKSKDDIQNFMIEHKKRSIQVSQCTDVYYLDMYASQFPYESYLIRFDSAGSKVLKYINNMKYLHLMGITREMMEWNLIQTQMLPCAIRVESYLDVWSKMFEAVSRKSNFFTAELQNYNGQRTFVKMEQRLIYIVQENDSSLYCYLYWIYHTNPNPAIADENYQKELDSQNPKPKQCTYKQICD